MNEKRRKTSEPLAKLLKARESRHSGQAKRDPESSIFNQFWIPAFAGMTEQVAFAKSSSLKVLLALFFFWMGVTGTVAAQEKMTIGIVEDVILMPWKVKIPARIDTGAAYSSLDARELIIKNHMAEFKLPRKYGGLKLRLPVVEWQTIRSAEAKERRAVVEIHLCLGNKYLRTRVNLNDRGGVKYPLLIGRNILQENFVVDCAQERCAPPICPEEPAK